MIAGGFGGLGAACVKFMVSRGARNFLIPTATQDPIKATQRLLADIAMPDVTIVGRRCDISNQDELKEFLAAGRAQLPPIKGCIQSTMLLRDGLLANMPHSDWQEAVRPKVMGTWNLHQQLPHDLDFFVVFSSTAALAGSRGQANYAAGNAFQDAVVRHRLARNQRAIGLNFGPLAVIGAVAAQQRLQDQLLSDGFEMTQFDEFSTLLEWALDPTHGHPSQDPDRNQIITGLSGVLDPRSRQKGEVYWLNRPLFSVLRNYESATDVVTDQASVDLSQSLKSHAGRAEEGASIVLEALVTKMSRALNRPATDIEPSQPIHAVGVDSLVSLEIRYWFMKEVKANLAVFDIMGAASLYDLSSLAWQKSPYATAD